MSRSDSVPPNRGTPAYLADSAKRPGHRWLIEPVVEHDRLVSSPSSDTQVGDLSGSTRALFDAVMAISSDLDLHSVLSRIVEAATRLTGARYGALGVVGPDSYLIEFVTTGLSEDERKRIGDLPHGQGILGLLIRDPRPIRMKDLAQHPSSYG